VQINSPPQGRAPKLGALVFDGRCGAKHMINFAWSIEVGVLVAGLCAAGVANWAWHASIGKLQAIVERENQNR
jgi:hypothetical protein